MAGEEVACSIYSLQLARLRCELFLYIEVNKYRIEKEKSMNSSTGRCPHTSEMGLMHNGTNYLGHISVAYVVGPATFYMIPTAFY